MANLKAIRRRIRSVQATQKITRAMRLVAAAKVRRAQQRVQAARPYSEAILIARRRPRRAHVDCAAAALRLGQAAPFLAKDGPLYAWVQRFSAASHPSIDSSRKLPIAGAAGTAELLLRARFGQPVQLR